MKKTTCGGVLAGSEGSRIDEEHCKRSEAKKQSRAGVPKRSENMQRPMKSSHIHVDVYCECWLHSDCASLFGLESSISEF